MNATNSPAPGKTRAQIVAEGLTSFRATVAAMQSALDVQILYGSGHFLTFTETIKRADGSTWENVRVFAKVNPDTRKPGAGAVECFPSLDTMPDHFCGVFMFSLERAQELIGKLTARGDFPGVTYRARHVRDVQGERLERARAMVANLEAIQARIAV